MGIEVPARHAIIRQAYGLAMRSVLKMHPELRGLTRAGGSTTRQEQAGPNQIPRSGWVWGKANNGAALLTRAKYHAQEIRTPMKNLAQMSGVKRHARAGFAHGDAGPAPLKIADEIGQSKRAFGRQR